MKGAQPLGKKPSNHPAVHPGRSHRTCEAFGSGSCIGETISNPWLVLVFVSSGLPLRRHLPCHMMPFETTGSMAKFLSVRENGLVAADTEEEAHYDLQASW